MEREKIKVPPCAVNPRTERPYTRHDWEIVPGTLLKRGERYFYHVRCKRKTCQVNDPRLLSR